MYNRNYILPYYAHRDYAQHSLEWQHYAFTLPARCPSRTNIGLHASNDGPCQHTVRGRVNSRKNGVIRRASKSVVYVA